MEVDSKDQIICHVCGAKTLPMVSFKGPHAYRYDVESKHFCCVDCFWKWIGGVIASRDAGGRLDEHVNWS